MHVRLIADSKTYNIRFEEKSITIGRSSSEADVAIPHQELSKNHCQFYFESGDAFIVDNTSKNGIYINEERINSLLPVKIRPGDRVTLGRNVILEVVGGKYSGIAG